MDSLTSKSFRYAIASPTSMGVRITPMQQSPVHVSNAFIMQATSAESNVLNISASLGLKTLALTKFVSDSPIASFIQKEMRARGIDYTGPAVAQGGAWGYRHQFNIADSGFGVRGPRVWNDRAGEVGRTLSVEDFDLQRIFEQDGVMILHLSGLIAALGPQTAEFCLQLATAAKSYGTMISFDLNYRASFWKGREEELTNVFSKIASLADILIGNEEDYQLALNLPGPEAGGTGLSDKVENFQQMIVLAGNKYPNVQTYATTLRQVKSANEHLWGAIMRHGDQWYIEAPRKISVLDRIGGGDGFVGGMLYAICRRWEAEKWIQFGWAGGALAAAMITDYACPADEAEMWSIYNGNARVKR